jgi:hypothetical protein
VIQQGLNTVTNYARRYHWLSDYVNNFIYEPHDGIVGEKSETKSLDMVSRNSKTCQNTCVDLVCDHPRHIINDWMLLTKKESQTTLHDWIESDKNQKIVENLDMPRSINWKKMKEIYDFQPKNYEELLGMKNVGPRTIRALALISDLIYGEKPSWQDPVKFSFAVGGKDGVPYPVDRKAMDESIEIIKSGINQAKIENKTKFQALRRLHNYFNKYYN